MLIAGLARQTGAGAVFWNEIAQAPHQAVADQVVAALSPGGVATQAFPGDLLVHPPICLTSKARACAYSRLSGGGYRLPAIPRAPAGPKRRAGVELGITYPRPIVDYKAERERALKAYAKLRAA
jgi:deoxyribodipyrimidine photolyase